MTSSDPVYAAEIARLGSDKVVLDFAQFHQPHSGPSADRESGAILEIRNGSALPA